MSARREVAQDVVQQRVRRLRGCRVRLYAGSRACCGAGYTLTKNMPLLAACDAPIHRCQLHAYSAGTQCSHGDDGNTEQSAFKSKKI